MQMTGGSVLHPFYQLQEKGAGHDTNEHEKYTPTIYTQLPAVHVSQSSAICTFMSGAEPVPFRL